MSRDMHTPQPDNYVLKIQAMCASGALPRTVGYHQVSVAHDDGCGHFSGRRCDCDPTIELKYSLSGSNN